VKLFKNMKFTAEAESSLMGHILDDKMAPEVAARAWIGAHADQVTAWKSGVLPAREEAASAASAASAARKDAPPTADGAASLAAPARKLPLGDWIERAIRFFTAR